jgi:hypothetical protein
MMNQTKQDINNDINQLYHSLEIPKSMPYIYPGLEYLNTDFSTLFSEISENDNIHICAYNVNVLGKYPFLQYFLYKPPNEDSFSFPFFAYNNEVDLLTKAMSIITAICSSYYKDTVFNYKGYIKEVENIYLFFDCSHMIIDTLKMSKYNDVWLAVMDEIVNYKSVYGFPVDENVFELFYKYENLSFLTDEEDTHYQCPIIGYSTCEVKKMDFVATFGIQIKNDFLGNYFYFTDYETTLKNVKDSNAFIRCIFFTDKMKIIFDDENSVDKQITDWNNNLSLLFDSVYFVSPSLKKNIWVVKNENQYNILSVNIKNI